MTAPKRKTALCLMAHPDDCEMAVAGTMLLLKERGWDCHILSMAPGDGGSMEHPPAKIADIRRAEGHAAAKLAGMTYHCAESRDCVITYDEITLRRLFAIVRTIAPSLIFTHYPVDYMIDHEETCKLARMASFAYSIPNAAPGSVVEGSQIPWLYYANPMGGIDLFGNSVKMTTHVDITRMMEKKTEMLKCHASQRNWLMAHHGTDEYTRSMQMRGETLGAEVGVKYAEGFRQHKMRPYPQSCILSQELGDLVVSS